MLLVCVRTEVAEGANTVEIVVGHENEAENISLFRMITY